MKVQDKPPLVSVICLCHNQKAYVRAALDSVYAQTYQHIELIVVDDGSTDGSKNEIRSIIDQSAVSFIDLPQNLGNCTSFNRGFEKSHGAFLIDLAADDILLPKRIEEGVNDFLSASPKAGVHFSDAFLATPDGEILSTHYERDENGALINQIPSGNIYLNLIKRYFICPPTMMFRRQVLEHLSGYDESLTYEDFDFWMRSSREFDYLFNKAPLVKKRVLPKSHATAQFKLRNQHALTTYKVCEKIYGLNQTVAEDKALIWRCNYDIRQCIRTLNLELIPKYLELIRKTQRRLSSASSVER